MARSVVCHMLVLVLTLVCWYNVRGQSLGAQAAGSNRTFNKPMVDVEGSINSRRAKKVLNGRAPLPKFKQRPCDPEQMFTTVKPCLPLAAEVIYDDFRTNFDEGCMKPFPIDMAISLINFDFEAVVQDEDVQWLLAELGLMEAPHDDLYDDKPGNSEHSEFDFNHQNSVNPDRIKPGNIKPDDINLDHISSDDINPDRIKPDDIKPDYINSGDINPDLFVSDHIKPAILQRLLKRSLSKVLKLNGNVGRRNTRSTVREEEPLTFHEVIRALRRTLNNFNHNFNGSKRKERSAKDADNSALMSRKVFSSILRMFRKFDRRFHNGNRKRRSADHASSGPNGDHIETVNITVIHSNSSENDHKEHMLRGNNSANPLNGSRQWEIEYMEGVMNHSEMDHSYFNRENVHRYMSWRMSMDDQHREEFEERERHFLESHLEDEEERRLHNSIFSVACPTPPDMRFIQFAMTLHNVPEFQGLKDEKEKMEVFYEMTGNWTEPRLKKLMTEYKRFMFNNSFYDFVLAQKVVHKGIYQSNLTHLKRNLTKAEMVKVLFDKGIVQKEKLLSDYQEELSSFVYYILAGPAAEVHRKWQIETQELENGMSIFNATIKGEFYENLSMLDVVRLVFEYEPRIRCANAIQLYQSIRREQYGMEGGHKPPPTIPNVVGRKEMDHSYFNPENVYRYLSERMSMDDRDKQEFEERERQFLGKHLEYGEERRLNNSIFSIACPIKHDMGFIQFVLRIQDGMRGHNTTGRYNGLNTTHSFKDGIDHPEVMKRFSEMTVNWNASMWEKIISEYRKFQLNKTFHDFVLSQEVVLKAISQLNITMNQPMEEIVKVIFDKGIVQKEKLLNDYQEELSSFAYYILAGPAAELEERWQVEMQEMENGMYVFNATIKGKFYENLSMLDAARLAFEHEQWMRCPNAIYVYQSIRRGDHHLLRDHEVTNIGTGGEEDHKYDEHSEERSDGPDVMELATGIIKFIHRKLIHDESKCGDNFPEGMMKKMVSLTTVDQVMSFAPMLVYVKNSIGRKYLRPGSPLNELLNEGIKYIFHELNLDYIDLLGEKGVFSFNEFPRYVRNFCKMFDVMGQCMNRRMRHEASKSACGQRWPDMRPWMETLPLRMCSRDRSGLIPSEPVLKVLEANFGFVFNFLSCFLNEDGSMLDFSMQTNSPRVMRLYQTLYTAVQVCDLEKFFKRLEASLVSMERRFRRSPLDIMEIVDFIQKTANSTAVPLRCFAKQFHPFCADRRVDLGLALKQMLPMLSMGSMGIVNIPTKVADYRVKTSFKSKDRMTVMAVGDPHIKTLVNNKGYETCNGLEYFDFPPTEPHFTTLPGMESSTVPWSRASFFTMTTTFSSTSATASTGETSSWGSSDSTSTVPSWGSTDSTSAVPSWGSTDSTSMTPSWGSSDSTSMTPPWGSSDSTSMTPSWGSSDSTNTAPSWGSSDSTSMTPSWGSSDSTNTAPSWGSADSTNMTPSWGSADSTSTAPLWGSSDSTSTAPTSGSADSTNTATSWGSTDSTNTKLSMSTDASMISTNSTTTKGPMSMDSSTTTKGPMSTDSSTATTVVPSTPSAAAHTERILNTANESHDITTTGVMSTILFTTTEPFSTETTSMPATTTTTSTTTTTTSTTTSTTASPTVTPTTATGTAATTTISNSTSEMNATTTTGVLSTTTFSSTLSSHTDTASSVTQASTTPDANGEPDALPVVVVEEEREISNVDEESLMSSGGYSKSLVASEKTVLMSNEWFKIEGTLARWSADVNGTFFKEVTLIVLEQLADGFTPLSKHVVYSFSSNSDMDSPRFLRVITNPSGPYVEMEEIESQEVQLNGNHKIKLRISTEEVQGQMRVVVKESVTGTIIAFSNPSGDIVNTYVRSGRPLLEMSTGLLIDGCSDSVNRTEMVQEAIRLRPKRSVGCNALCENMIDYADMCSFDCMTAEDSGVEDEVVLTSYAAIETVVEQVVESPEVEAVLIEEAEEEVVDLVEILTTTPSPEDLQASGGLPPVEGMEEALTEAAEENVAQDEMIQLELAATTTTEPPITQQSNKESPLAKVESTTKAKFTMTIPSTTKPTTTKPTKPTTVKPTTAKPTTTKPTTVKPTTVKLTTARSTTVKPTTARTNSPTTDYFKTDFESNQTETKNPWDISSGFTFTPAPLSGSIGTTTHNSGAVILVLLMCYYWIL